MSITKEEVAEVVKATIEGMHNARPLAEASPPSEEHRNHMAFEEITRAIGQLSMWNETPVTKQAREYLKGLLKEM